MKKFNVGDTVIQHTAMAEVSIGTIGVITRAQEDSGYSDLEVTFTAEGSGRKIGSKITVLTGNLSLVKAANNHIKVGDLVVLTNPVYEYNRGIVFTVSSCSETRITGNITFASENVSEYFRNIGDQIITNPSRVEKVERATIGSLDTSKFRGTNCSPVSLRIIGRDEIKKGMRIRSEVTNNVGSILIREGVAYSKDSSGAWFDSIFNILTAYSPKTKYTVLNEAPTPSIVKSAKRRTIIQGNDPWGSQVLFVKNNENSWTGFFASCTKHYLVDSDVEAYLVNEYKVVDEYL